MEKTRTKRLLSLLLCAMMVFSLMPVTAFASTSFTQSQLSVVTDKRSQLADGVTQNLYTVYDSNGDQVKLYAATADMNVETVKLFAAYKDMDNTSFGMSKLTEQVAAFDAKAANGDEYYKGTVVAGINASYYNMISGQPTGVFVMNGYDATGTNNPGGWGYFAVMKDGSVKIGKNSEYASDKGNIQEAIGIYKGLIYNGEIVAGLNSTEKYTRQTIGITADNKVIVLTADGNQAPTSCGLTELEQAKVMADLGCIYAGHLDGGGSATYGSKAEGTDTFAITNNPSDGSERSVANGFIIVSQEAATKEFSKVKFSVDDEYVTPGTSVNVSYRGVSTSGNAADIPDDVTYEVSNGTLANGVLTAGNLGTTTITAMRGGESVGSVSVNVVLPDTLKLDTASITIPYEKEYTFDITATYNSVPVLTKASDYSIEFSSFGMLTRVDGLTYRSCSDSSGITSGTATIELSENGNISTTVEIAFGKASKVVYDFETGSVGDLSMYVAEYSESTPYGNMILGSCSIANATTGKVRNGDYSLAISINSSQMHAVGHHRILLDNLNIDYTGATALGFWIYIPTEFTGLSSYFLKEVIDGGRTNLKDAQGWFIVDKEIGHTKYTEDGWYYVSVDLTKMTLNEEKINKIGFKMNDMGVGPTYNDTNIYVNSTFYIDDITLDYSSAVDDRVNPTIASINYLADDLSTPALTGQTITSNTLSLSAQASDNVALDTSSAKLYIDGYKYEGTVKCGENGLISSSEITLADGYHTIRFEIQDKSGNTGIITRSVIINTEQGGVYFTKANNSEDDILIGSVQYYNITAKNIENVASVSAVIDLDSISSWYLDQMKLAEGFTANYKVDPATNNATITLTKTGSVTASGEAVIASIPVRTWVYDPASVYPLFADKVSNNPNDAENFKVILTPYAVWHSDANWNKSIIAKVIMGEVTYTDDSKATFTSDSQKYQTECNFYQAENKEHEPAYDGKDSWHIHTKTTLDDKTATCTEDGYTGRTFCEVCNSVVDWGTTVPATGHSYELENDKFVCTNENCGNVYTCSGLFTMNGNTYYAVDGKLIKNKWVQTYDGTWYCMRNDYTPYTGDCSISGRVYHFGETGAITKGQWFYVNANGQGTDKEHADYLRYYVGPQFYYSACGLKLQEIDGKVYGFDKNGNICTGYVYSKQYASDAKALYLFDENGIQQVISKDPQIITLDDSLRYINEGVLCANNGLIKIGNDYYYIHGSGAVETGTIYVNTGKANGLLPAGTYTFGADGKLQLKNGVIDGRYYIDSVMQVNLGLIKVDGDYYYIHGSGAVETGTFYVNAGKTNGLLPAGTYTFGADGKLILANS